MLLAAIDLGGQIDRFLRAAGDFLETLGRVDWPFLVAALILSLAMQLCRGHAWANALRAAYPGDTMSAEPGQRRGTSRAKRDQDPVSEVGVVGSFLVGVGMNGILPARGGDALKIVLAKRVVPGSRYPTIIASFACLAPFDTGIGLLVLLYAITQGLLPAAPRLPELPAFEISFWAANPHLFAFTLVVIGLALTALVLYASRHVEAFWQRIKQGVAVLRDPARYMRDVFAWQAVAWLLRFASFWLFLDAFGIGGSFDNVLLVMSVQAISSALPFTPGGAGAQQALLVVALDGPTYLAVLAYSVGQQLAVAAWSLLIAVIALAVIFRSRDWRRMLREGREARAET